MSFGSKPFRRVSLFLPLSQEHDPQDSPAVEDEHEVDLFILRGGRGLSEPSLAHGLCDCHVRYPNYTKQQDLQHSLTPVLPAMQSNRD